MYVLMIQTHENIKAGFYYLKSNFEVRATALSSSYLENIL